MRPSYSGEEAFQPGISKRSSWRLPVDHSQCKVMSQPSSSNFRDLQLLSLGEGRFQGAKPNSRPSTRVMLTSPAFSPRAFSSASSIQGLIRRYLPESNLCMQRQRLDGIFSGAREPTSRIYVVHVRSRTDYSRSQCYSRTGKSAHVMALSLSRNQGDHQGRQAYTDGLAFK